MIQKGELLIRCKTYDDLGKMASWLNDPKVLEFYEEHPLTFDQVLKKYGPRIEGNHYVKPCIVEYKNKPIGYMQYYEVQETELETYEYPINQNIFGIDQFIGETQLWGKGLGTSMIQLLLYYLSEKKGASRVLLDVKTHNYRAISCYEKCGFKKIKKLNDDFILMEWSKGELWD
ncbi:aminoglycoside 6'-N-acetyltransferase [Bacillus sp. SORGH_AS 510]|uniref:GNAT family N-acetyltransferase n=1 Tax=Bacillus sp. SORGH_AS_0510 TaxID=3041771 RepID=UPI00277E137E|nr:GNAT family N-acetyltransferase [Bacillus sp. SORGH_AS_0510]MDQ1147650.1 aminoglycoside 6'-N-acetyltransferase [Bacillus sp. SORGH_AS_0510]